ncbi:peptidoglycan-binding protein [Streptomyces sp. SID14478]|uniref:peptidoglycan-binding protein n=1 Tax=Streptomyces sp. SID14478 TaxID=2706073 RepID=UPI0013DB251A|nr:peptidoglycan-binding protein [Streptomyces sp. SID14478]
MDVQQRLRQLQLYIGPVDGYYSEEVAAAVTRIQQARAVPETPGVYGERTRAVVEAETAGAGSAQG